MTPKELLLYCYYGGMIHIGQQHPKVSVAFIRQLSSLQGLALPGLCLSQIIGRAAMLCRSPTGLRSPVLHEVSELGSQQTPMLCRAQGLWCCPPDVSACADSPLPRGQRHHPGGLQEVDPGQPNPLRWAANGCRAAWGDLPWCWPASRQAACPAVCLCQLQLALHLACQPSSTTACARLKTGCLRICILASQ